MNTTPKVVVVMSSAKRRARLLPQLASVGAQVLGVPNCRDARCVLQGEPNIKVVITDVTLPDGNWCDVLRYVLNCGLEASVVVSSPVADENFWSEVIWRGAYDLLVEPWERPEVRRILEGAIRAADSLRPGGYRHPAVTAA